MYKIIGITKNGRTRTDGRYPLRVGCVGSLVCLELDLPMMFKYSRDADGNVKDGVLSTSKVGSFRRDEDVIIVSTMNSTYTLWKVS